MSETALSAMDIEAQAAAYLRRRETGDWQGADQAALDTWLSQSDSHCVAFWRLEAAWDRAQRLSALNSSAPEEIAPPRSTFLPLMLKIAAVAGVAAIIGAASINFLPHPQERTYRTALGGRETVSFADGSRIELNTDTVLRARMTTDQRIVWLDKGEAYFQIKHDPTHPFIVMAGKHRVTDLGTQFDVRRDSTRLQVAVVQGRVTFDTPEAQASSQVALLRPGDVATATANAISLSKKTAEELATELGWRRGVLVFYDTPLGEAAAEFNRYNREKIVVSESAARVPVVGTFPTYDVEDFARLAHLALGLHVERHGSETLIAR